MKNITDEDINNLDFDTMGQFLISGNEILTGSTARDGQLEGADPLTCGAAACDYLHWIKDNTPYYTQVGTGFWSHSSFLYFRVYKKEDDSLVREWLSGAITSRTGTYGKMGSIHEALGVTLLRTICSYINDNFSEE